MKKNILGVTSSRADYDLQKEIFKKITLNDKFNFDVTWNISKYKIKENHVI